MPKGTDDHVGFFALQSKHTSPRQRYTLSLYSIRTLLAGFDFSLSKIFCDCVFVARLIVNVDECVLIDADGA